MTFSCFKQNGRHVLRETSALPSCTLCDDVSLCLGRIIGSNSVDFHIWVVESLIHHTHSLICFHGNTKECDKPRRSVPKYTIWLRPDMPHMRVLDFVCMNVTSEKSEDDV